MCVKLFVFLVFGDSEGGLIACHSNATALYKALKTGGMQGCAAFSTLMKEKVYTLLNCQQCETSHTVLVLPLNEYAFWELLSIALLLREQVRVAYKDWETPSLAEINTLQSFFVIFVQKV